MVRVDVASGSNVALQSVAASPAQYAAGSGTVRVVMAGVGMQGKRTELRVTDGAATVGSAVDDWSADGEIAVDVPWWPLADGSRTLRVSAIPFNGEATAIDNAIDVGVNVPATSTRDPWMWRLS